MANIIFDSSINPAAQKFALEKLNGKNIETLNPAEKMRSFANAENKKYRRNAILIYLLAAIIFTALLSFPIATYFYMSANLFATKNIIICSTLSTALSSFFSVKIYQYLKKTFLAPPKENAVALRHVAKEINKPKEKPEVKLSMIESKDKEKIIEIVTTLGALPTWKISWNQSLTVWDKEAHLKKLGRETKDIHPLKFLEVIFLDPNPKLKEDIKNIYKNESEDLRKAIFINPNPKMKEYMKKIYQDSTKWKNFFRSLELSLNRQYRSDNLLQHVDDFAKEVNIPKEQLQHFLNEKDWEGFVKFLIFN